MNEEQLLYPRGTPISLAISAEHIRHNFTKRTFDIVFSLIVIALPLPLFLCIGLLIAITSKGKIIYGHKRMGRGGTPFYCYKFRTMYADADARLKELLKTDPAIRAEWESSFKLKNDPRITPLGKFLRKTSLDEFPQFWNVIKGDLSVVGPRPVVEDEMVKYFNKRAAIVLSIRPGLTGLWQVSGRSNVSYEERIRLDEEYVKTQSFWLDLKLIAKTLPAILSSRGAY